MRTAWTRAGAQRPPNGVKRPPRDSTRKGQAVVELALTLPVLLLLLLGMINLGLTINAQIILTQAAWEGARAGATITDPAHGDAEITGAVERSLTGLDPRRVQLEISPAQDETPRDQPRPMPRGSPLTVSLDYDLALSMPFIIHVPLHASAVSRMEYQNP